jgi:hypothetical protein
MSKFAYKYYNHEFKSHLSSYESTKIDNNKIKLIDWLIFNANFSSISVLSLRTTLSETKVIQRANTTTSTTTHPP